MPLLSQTVFHMDTVACGWMHSCIPGTNAATERVAKGRATGRHVLQEVLPRWAAAYKSEGRPPWGGLQIKCFIRARTMDGWPKPAGGRVKQPGRANASNGIRSVIQLLHIVLSKLIV